MAAITHTHPADSTSAMGFLKGKKFSASVTANMATMPKRAYVSQGDTIEMVPVMKGLLVTDVFLRMDASLVAVSSTVSVGDASNVIGYCSAVSTKDAIGILKRSLQGGDPYAKTGRIYTSNGETVDVKFSAVSGATSNVSVGTITLVVEGVLIEEYA